MSAPAFRWSISSVQKGVVPSLISVAAMTILTSWWFSRKIEVQVATVSLSLVRQEVSALLKLGSAFMASGLMTLGVAYFVRVIRTPQDRV